MHTRKVITRSGACVRGCFYSLKSRRLNLWQSQLERDGFLVLEFDKQVVSFREYQQEVWIDAGDDRFHCYPDVIAKLVDGSTEIIEIKSDAALTDPEVAYRLSRIAAHFKTQRIDYRILAESEIRRQPRLRNFETLATHRRPFTREHLVRNTDVREILNLGHSTTLGYVTSRLGNAARAYQLIANDLLTADLARFMHPEMRVSPAQWVTS